MQFEKLTIKTQEALSRAQVIASENGHQTIEDIHLISALLEQKDSIIIPILAKLEINTDEFIKKVDDSVRRFPKVSGQNVQIYLSSQLNDILNTAAREAEQLKDDFISTEHILIALSESRGKIGELLKQY